MKNSLNNTTSTEVRQGVVNKKNVLLTMAGIGALVGNLLISDQTKALQITVEIGNPECNPNSNYRGIFDQNRQVLKEAGLTPNEIVAVEKIFIRDVTNRQKGIISKRAFTEISSTGYAIRHSKEKNIKVPNVITRKNYHLFVDKVFDCEEFDIILTNEKIRKEQKEGLIEQMRQDRKDFICAIAYMDEKYGEKATNEWLALSNMLISKNKEKTITKLSSLLNDAQKLIMVRRDKIGKSGLEKVQLEQEEIMLAIKIYVTLFDKIDGALVSYTVRGKGSECHYIIGKNKLGFLGISTKHTIIVAQEAYIEYLKKGKEAKLEDTIEQFGIIKEAK